MEILSDADFRSNYVKNLKYVSITNGCSCAGGNIQQNYFLPDKLVIPEVNVIADIKIGGHKYN